MQLLGVLVWSCFATSFSSMPFAERVDRTQIIVRGKVGATRNSPFQGEDGVRRAGTLTDLQVTEALRGPAQPGERIQIRGEGGEIDGTRVDVDGAAHLAPGEDVVLFLTPGGQDSKKPTYLPSGMSMGAFRVTTEGGETTLQGPGYAKGEKPWSLEALRKRAALPPPLLSSGAMGRLNADPAEPLREVRDDVGNPRRTRASAWRWLAAGLLVVLLVWRSRLRKR